MSEPRCVMTADREALSGEIARVLGEHEAWEDSEYVLHCACGSKFYPEQRDARRAHLADAIADRVRRETAAEALREAADALDDHTNCDCEDGDHLRRLATPTWLRNRAAREQAR